MVVTPVTLKEIMNRKMKQFASLTALFFSVALVSCNDVGEELFGGEHQGQTDKLTISEAKSIFEDEASAMYLTRSENTEKSPLFNPGDFVPVWSDGVAVSNSKLDYVILPIKAENTFKVVRSTYELGKPVLNKVETIQKLIVIKQDSCKNTIFVSTFIPDKDYEQPSSGNIIDTFTGCVVYSDLANNYPWSVIRYVAGRITKVSSLQKLGFDHKLHISNLREILGEVLILGHTSVQTRSGEDDNYINMLDETYCEPDIPLPPDPEFPDSDTVDLSDDEQQHQQENNEDNKPDDADQNQYDADQDYWAGQNSQGSDGGTSSNEFSPEKYINSRLRNHDDARNAFLKVYRSNNKFSKTVKDLMKNGPQKFQFVPHPSKQAPNAPASVGYSIELKTWFVFINPNLADMIGEKAWKVIWCHEYYHLMSRMNLTNESDRVKEEEIVKEHKEMVGNDDYMDFLEEAIPGHDDDFYFNLSYAGTYGSKVFTDLPEERQLELMTFFKTNKIYHD